MNNSKIEKLLYDIKEINQVLYNAFDREKAIEIIRKHNLSDATVATINSPHNPGYVTFNQASDEALANNLVMILNVLNAKLAEEQFKK